LEGSGNVTRNHVLTRSCGRYVGKGKKKLGGEIQGRKIAHWSLELQGGEVTGRSHRGVEEPWKFKVGGGERRSTWGDLLNSENTAEGIYKDSCQRGMAA